MVEDTITLHEGLAIASKVSEIEDLAVSLLKEVRQFKKFLHGKFQLEED